MIRTPLLRFAVPLALAVVLGACTQQNTADQQAQQAAAAVADVALGIDRLLLFPNPIGTDPLAQNGGTFETDTTDYATAYYAAIDPNNTKDTIDKWRAVNGFNGFANPARPGTEHLAVFRDTRDLGYGRRMTARRNSDDNSIAFYVENYNVAPSGSVSYSSELNVNAAILRDTKWHVGTNAIEWSATPCLTVANGYPYNYDPPDCDNTGNVKFAKYYNFSSKDGTRQVAVDLDGHGLKAMPGPCITCHGGRGDPLTPPDVSGKPRFPLVENLPSRKRGDVGAHLHGQNVDSFSFSTEIAGFAKSDMQPLLKDFNQWIMCTYPWDPAGTTPQTIAIASGGSCLRQTAGANEWQGTAAEMIQAWYGGPGMPAPAFSDTYVPAGWSGNTALYQGVVAPFCRTCHILRGTKNQDDLNFFNFGNPAGVSTPATGFLSYADRIKVHVFDRGNMPLAEIPHSNFWNSPTAPQMLASFVDSQLGAGTATFNGAPLMPGRPIADPGPDRMVRTNANAVLTGENSLFASSFLWTSVSGPSAASIDNPMGMVAIFNANTAGTYVVNLSVNGGASSKNVTITVDDNFPDPLNIKFAQVKNVLQNVTHTVGATTAHCIDCHTPAVNVVTNTRVPPIWYTTLDRNHDGLVNSTDEDWFLKALAGRVNLTEIEASALLRKPTGNHHNGGKVIDTDTSSGTAGLRNYSILYNWVLAGMQPGGVAANAVVNGNAPLPPLTFAGSPLFSTNVTLAGGTSINATNFQWTVTGPSGPTGAVPVISNPTSASAVLNVPNVGPYVVQLHVDDGISSDAVQQTVTVSEPPITANFNPQAGSVTVTSPSAGRGNVVLSSTSTYQGVAGSPVNCRWQVLTGPAGALLDGSALLDVTKPCSTDAVLNIPTSAAGGTYNVQLTASAIGSGTPVAHALTVSNSAPTPNLNSTVSQGVVFSQTSTRAIPTHATVSATSAFTGNVNISVVTASVSLSGAGSTTPTGTLTYAWCLSSQPDSTNFPASIPICPSKTTPNLSPTTTMTVGATGSYGVQLTVDNGFGSASLSKTITVSPSQGVTFASAAANSIVNTVTCGGGCHLFGSSTLVNPTTGQAPEWDNATMADGTTLYQRIMQRVVLANPATSRLLTCPQGSCAGMPGYAWSPGNTPYSDVLKWIQDGAPPGN